MTYIIVKWLHRHMCITSRHKIGLALMATSVLAAILTQLLTGRLVEVRTVREDKLPSGVVASEIVLDCHWRYGIPMTACFALGLICFVWPSRRPPRPAS
jgi:hypothetical protein